MAATAWKNIIVLRGLAMGFVVLIHSTRIAGYNIYCTLDTFSPLQYPIEFAFVMSICSIAPFCLPAFVFASGFSIYRMYMGWKVAWSMAFQTLKKYLVWSGGLFLLISLIESNFDLVKILKGILVGGPMSGYWFLVLIIVLYLVSPALIFLVKSHPKIAIGAMIVLQLIDFILFYFNKQSVFNEILKSLVILPLMFLPPFIAGIFFSKNTAKWMLFLSDKRALLKVLAVILAVMSVVETMFWGHLDEWSTTQLSHWISTERITLYLFSIILTALIISSESDKTRLRQWLSDIGLASLGILLLMDICQAIMSYLLWHVPYWLHQSPLTAYQPGMPPKYLVHAGLFAIPIFFAAGILGSLLIMNLSKLIIGRYTNRLW